MEGVDLLQSFGWYILMTKYLNFNNDKTQEHVLGFFFLKRNK